MKSDLATIELDDENDKAEHSYQNKIDKPQSLSYKYSFRLNKGGQSQTPPTYSGHNDDWIR